jgi:hypothetical protein
MRERLGYKGRLTLVTNGGSYIQPGDARNGPQAPRHRALCIRRLSSAR